MAEALITMTGGRKGKRLLSAKQVLEAVGQNPIMNMVRLAIKAEKRDDIPTALRGWAEIQCYVEAKKKAIDPVEQLDRLNRLATLDELHRIKSAILDGTIINDDGTIDMPAIEYNPQGLDLI